MAYVAHTSKTKNNFKLDKQELKVSALRIATDIGDTHLSIIRNIS